MEIPIITKHYIKHKCEGPFQGAHTRLDKVLYKWFTVAHFKIKPVTGPMVIDNV